MQSNFEILYNQLIDLSNNLMLLEKLNQLEFLHLKKTLTRLMFKSYHLISNNDTNIDFLVKKCIFFEYIENFLEYLQNIK